MGDICGEICVSLCGICAIFSTTSLGVWCNQQSYGSGGCCGSRGCCGSCCADSFNEDAFDKAVQKDMAKTRDPNAPQPLQAETAQSPKVVNEQPTADVGHEMSLPGSHSGTT